MNKEEPEEKDRIKFRDEIGNVIDYRDRNLRGSRRQQHNFDDDDDTHVRGRRPNPFLSG